MNNYWLFEIISNGLKNNLQFLKSDISEQICSKLQEFGDENFWY